MKNPTTSERPVSQWRQLARDGLWSNNPALVQLLGLCPLLAVSGSVVNALGLAIATLLVMVGASTAISLIRHQVPSAVRLPAFVMIIAFASRQPVVPAAIDGLMMGLGFAAVLILLGALRELLGQGTLFSDMALLFGPQAAHWQLTIADDYQFLFFVLPPGAFFVAGMLIALKNAIDQRSASRAHPAAIETRVDRRVRVTGTIK